MRSVPDVSLREQHRLASWRALQAAAVRLVGERGFAAVTVDDVAGAAGVSRRTFFNHFPTKAAALFDPDPDDAARLDQLLAAADGGPDLWAALRGVWLGFLDGAQALQLAAVRRQLVDDPELAAYVRSAYRFVEDAMERWASRRQAADPFTSSLAVHAAGAAVATAFGTWSPRDDPAGFLPAVARGFDALAPAFR